MPETLPAVSGDPSVLLTALARAAAEIAAQEAGRRQGGAPLDREAVEGIVEEALQAAFLRIGVDLSDHKSVAAFNQNIGHAERARGLWEKAGATAFGGVMTALVAGVIAACIKYVSAGGVK